MRQIIWSNHPGSTLYCHIAHIPGSRIRRKPDWWVVGWSRAAWRRCVVLAVPGCTKDMYSLPPEQSPLSARYWCSPHQPSGCDCQEMGTARSPGSRPLERKGEILRCVCIFYLSQHHDGIEGWQGIFYAAKWMPFLLVVWRLKVPGRHQKWYWRRCPGILWFDHQIGQCNVVIHLLIIIGLFYKW